MRTRSLLLAAAAAGCAGEPTSPPGLPVPVVEGAAVTVSLRRSPGPADPAPSPSSA